MRKVGASIVGIILGLLATTGLYEFLVQNGNIDPNNKVGLVFPVFGVILGILAGGFGGRRKKKAPAAPAAPAAAPPAAPE